MFYVKKIIIFVLNLNFIIMPEKHKKHIPFKKRREIAKRAKIQAGMYGRRGRKNKVKGSTARDYSEKTTPGAIKDVAHNVGYKLGLTKRRYRLSKAEGGSHGDPAVINQDRIQKPKKEVPGFIKRHIESPRKPGGKSKEIYHYGVTGTTEEEIKKGVEEKEKEMKEKYNRLSSFLPKELLNKEGKKEVKRNEEKESEYQKERKALKEKQKKLSLSRKDFVRTQEQNARDSRRHVASRDYEKKYGINRGKRKLKRRYKEKLKEDYRKQINS